MFGKKPVTKQQLLEMLEDPENVQLRDSVLGLEPVKKEAIIALVLEFDKIFDSFEDFKKSMDEYVEMKNRSREDTLAGTEAIL